MTLVVGFTPEKPDRSALHLGAVLARSAGQALQVVTAVPGPWPTPVAGGTDREFNAWSRAHGERAVAATTALIAEHLPDVDATAVAVPGSSVASALLAHAEKVDASMVVVGSGSDGSWGTVVTSSISERLLHSSPVPVAVATRGYRAEPGATVDRATCAFRGDDASAAVLVRTAEICQEVGASLRVATFGVRGRTMYPPEVLGEDEILAAYVEATAAAQDKAVSALPTGITGDVETVVATGRSWSEAVSDLPWAAGDVLVVGSSAASLMSRLFLGSTATKIVRHSPVPVVVVP